MKALYLFPVKRLILGASFLLMLVSGCEKKQEAPLSEAFKAKFLSSCEKNAPQKACACVLLTLSSHLSGGDIQAINSGDLLTKEKFSGLIKKSSKNCK